MWLRHSRFVGQTGWSSHLCRIFSAFSWLMSMPSSARDCWISEASMRPVVTYDPNTARVSFFFRFLVEPIIIWLVFPTVVVSVQTLERQPQLLLVVLQILGELAEVQTPILVLVSGGHDFLQELRRWNLTACSATLTHQWLIPAGLSRTSMTHSQRWGVCGVTCAAPRRNIPMALRPARSSATSTFPSLLVSSLSNRSWYDLSLSASQHRAPGSKNVRSARYMLAAESGQPSPQSCDATEPFAMRIHLHSW